MSRWMDSFRLAAATDRVGPQPKCGYTVREKVNGVETAKQCGAPYPSWRIKGTGRYGRARETPICDKHLERAWKEWAVDSAERFTSEKVATAS